MSRFEVLARHYEREQERAYGRYLDCRRGQELEWASGRMTPEEYRQLSEEVEAAREDYYSAQASGWPNYRQGEEAGHLLMCCRKLEAARRKQKAADDFRELLHSGTLATLTLAPPLERRSVSISAHGPPSGPVTEHGALLGIT